MRVFLAGLAALVTIAVAAEMVLRAYSPEPRDNRPSTLERIKLQSDIRHVPYVPDPDLGAVMAASQTRLVDTPDYTYTMRTDHAGFPNLDPWPERLDVAVLGNSLITGSGVGYEGQFTTLLQDGLGGPTVLNFGIHGGGSEHQLRAYRKFAASLKPRLVVAALWLVWEIDNSQKFADWLDEDPRPDFTEYRLSYTARERDASAGVNGDTRTIRHFLRGSRLVRQFHRWFQAVRGVRDPIEQVTLGGGDVLLLSTRNQARLMSGWTRPGAGDLRELFFAPLEQLKTEVEANGGTLLVVLFPGKEELYAAGKFPEILDVVEVARAELAARQMATLDLYPVFERTAAGPPAFFGTDMHPNALGHRMAADAIAAWATGNEIFTLPGG